MSFQYACKTYSYLTVNISLFDYQTALLWRDSNINVFISIVDQIKICKQGHYNAGLNCEHTTYRNV